MLPIEVPLAMIVHAPGESVCSCADTDQPRIAWPLVWSSRTTTRSMVLGASKVRICVPDASTLPSSCSM